MDIITKGFWPQPIRGLPAIEPGSDLCKCSLTAGNYLLSQTDNNCRDMPEARDSYFTTYYAFNKIILDIITVKFDIQVDDNTITQSALLHDDIQGYNLLTLGFVLPPVDDDKDLIFKEENPKIYAHLENVLVHMIEAQDIAIFKSKRDYVRNKQKLSEYICRASARPPAFLPTMPRIPSRLEGRWSHKAPSGYRSLNGANDLGQKPDSS